MAAAAPALNAPWRGAIGALLLPTLVTATSFFTGFLVIGITGLFAGLIA